MSSKGKSQSGATKIGASVNFFFKMLNASTHSFEKKNGEARHEAAGSTLFTTETPADVLPTEDTAQPGEEAEHGAASRALEKA